MVYDFLKGYYRSFVNLFYPNTCCACAHILENETDVLCASCINQLPKTLSTQRELPFLKERLWGRANIDYVFAFLYYRKRGLAQELVYQFKYGNNKELAQQLGRLFAKELKENSAIHQENSVLVPVPLHTSKRQLRGYNQAEELCKGLSEVLEIPINTHSLIRTQQGVSQTKKSRHLRWESLKDSYGIANEELRGKNILLVDDILTTGATFDVCFEQLSGTNPQSVGILSLAVTPPK